MTSRAPRALPELIASLKRGSAQLTSLTPEGVGYLSALLSADPSATPLSLIITATEERAALIARATSAHLGAGRARAWSAPPSPFATLTPSRAQEGAKLADLTSLARGVWPQAPPQAERAEPQVEPAPVVLCLSIEALCATLPPPERLLERSINLKVDEEIDREELLAALSAASYERVEVVTDPGTFSARGELVDVYLSHHPLPYRLSFWGDELQEIRAFSPQTQHSLDERVEQVELCATRSLRLDSEGLNALIDGLYWAYDDLCEEAEAGRAPQPSHALLQRWVGELEQGLLPIGVEACAPRAHEEGAATLLDYLSLYLERQADALEGEPPLCVLVYEPERSLERLAHVRERWAAALDEERARLIYAPLSEHLAEGEATLSALAQRLPLIEHRAEDLRASTHHLGLAPLIALRGALDAARATATPFAPLLEAVEGWRTQGVPTLIACAHEGQRARLERLLTTCEPTRSERTLVEEALEPHPHPLRLCLAPLSEGWHLTSPPLILLSATELLAQPLPPARAGEHSEALLKAAEALESPFVEAPDELKEGDHVVHADYGVAVFRGVEQIIDRHARGGPTEVDCVRLEFAKGELMLLPIYRLHLLQRFVGTSKPRLGDPKNKRKWSEQQAKAREEANTRAFELLELYAARAQREGVSYSAPDERFKAFEEAFPYTETPDQLRATAKIIKEMCAPHPMDHLLCGDVGFGKTEVAMRAAMKALLDGKQVALLAPTTILASQHTKTFRERFKGTPFKIEQLSRFVSAERKREVIEGLSTRAVHLVIGTQSLLQDRVVIPELGLLILDEEHRFGVQDKERLKGFKAELDVLSMTATPIPRTLHLSLNGLRSMSILSTPPRDRLSVYTQLSRLSPSLVREASLAELRRGGQVFYVYNRVETIETKRAWLQTLLPSATIDVAHGKMRPEELEEVMQRFVEGRSQVLVCTTLIETGIDIPRANTMFIDKAHTFGLAQLYQLRGRVGRSHERARCYLLVPAEDLISDTARERLKVLSRFTELGSGFHIASHDLELRGAGDLLGIKQNGQSQQIGLELYHELLQEAIARQQGQRLSHRFEPELKLPYTEREVLPSDYIESSRVRLTTYRRLAQCRTLAALEPVIEELRDRFGAPPPHAEATLTRWRALILARELGVELVSYERGALTLQLHADSPFPHSAMPPVTRALGAAHFTDLKDGIWRYKPNLKARADLIYALATWLTHMHDQLLINPVPPTRSLS